MLYTILPELPRKLQKRESKITPQILAWFRLNYPHSCAIEIKVTKTRSIPASALKPHQKQALLQAQSELGITWKIPDTSRTRLPFDAFQLKNSHAFVVACFLNHGVYLAIDPAKWIGATPETIPTFPILL